jgi:exonuclease III
MPGKNRNSSILTLNVNGLNAPIKKHRIANCFTKQEPKICCLQETHTTEKINTGPESKGGKKFPSKRTP